jgi:hypothetical protein
MSEKTLKERIMDPLTIGLLCFLGGGLVTGGTIWGIQSAEKEKENTADVINAIGNLETKFEQSQAQAVTNLTEPDLLKIPCSMEFINGTFDKDGKQLTPPNGDLLCREMFCRMNRQGGGQNSSGGAGATESDCASISAVQINKLKIDACMTFWDAEGNNDQNSKFSRCIVQFDKKP